MTEGGLLRLLALYGPSSHDETGGEPTEGSEEPGDERFNEAHAEATEAEGVALKALEEALGMVPHNKGAYDPNVEP